MKVFFFGAGSSAGTLSDIPVAGRFGQGLRSADRNWRSSFPAITRVARHLGYTNATFGLEPVWTCFDYYAKLHAAIPWRKPWVEESPNIKKALLAVYGSRVDRLSMEFALSPSATLVDLLGTEVARGDLLVSFNYDTLVENLAVRLGLKLVPVEAQSRLSTSAVSLAKPHGSTSWRMYLKSKSLRTSNPRGGPCLVSVTAEEVDRKIEPLLLGAVPIKSELIEQVQGRRWRIYSHVAAQWSAVLDRLSRATTLVVVGYSFPQEDLYGRFMFVEAMRRRRKRLDIEFFELPRFRRRREQAIRETFGNHLGKLVYRGKVTSR